MKKVCIIVCAFGLILTIGCNKGVAVDSTTGSHVQEATTFADGETTTIGINPTEGTTQTQNSDVEVPLEKRGQAQVLFKAGREDAERLGVSKVLVWVTAGTIADMICETPEIISKFNELLVKKYGCDFVVEFQVYSSLWQEVVEDEKGDTHWADRTYMHDEIIVDMMKLGHQADVIYSSLNATFAGVDNVYGKLIEEGVYIPITDYLKTEEGKLFYEAYPDSIWKKVIRNGEIYAFNRGTEAVNWYALTCNQDIAGELGIELEENYSFYDLGDILSQITIPESENVKEQIFPIYVAPGNELNCLIRMEGYHPIDELSGKDSAVYYTIDANTNKWKAVNAAEEQSLIKLWKTIKEYNDKGWIYFSNSTISALTKKGNFLFLVLRANDAVLDENKIKYGKIFDVAVGDKWYEANHEITADVTGIASWSEYKDEAFRLLTLVNTEKELSILLAYGIEGKNYIYEDGVLTGFESSGAVYAGDYSNKRNNFGNPNLLHPTGLEPDNKLEFYKEIGENFKDSPSMIYDIDMSAYEDKLSNISKIYNEYLDKLNTGKCEDVDAVVAEMNVRLKEAGITEIVNDINRQLEAAQQ